MKIFWKKSPSQTKDGQNHNKQPISRWNSSFTQKQWIVFIQSDIVAAIDRGIHFISLIGSESLSRQLRKRLLQLPSAQNLQITIMKNPISITKLSTIRFPSSKTAIVACSPSDSDVTQILKCVLKHPQLKYSEFIFKIRAPTLLVKSKNYISPIFQNSTFVQIYDYSLQKCEPKCEYEEAHDLYQMLVQTNAIQGVVAEFGSYRGHSGFIISETLKRLRRSKSVYLCDTFSAFPKEQYAVDKFWSNTHTVNFEKIQQLFQSYPNVTLIRGDFADTINTIHEKKFSLVYVDCDSYRATKLVTEKIYPKLSIGGVMIYEDYGHAHCLGARYAINEYYTHKKSCQLFFSYFSGFMIVWKN